MVHVPRPDRGFLGGYSRVGGGDGQFRLGPASRVNFVAFHSQHRDEEGVERDGPVLGAYLQHEGRHLQATAFASRIDPDFRTDVWGSSRRPAPLRGANRKLPPVV